MSETEMTSNVKDTNVWKRLLFMVLFALLWSVTEIVMFAVVVYQFLYLLITGNKDERILKLGAQLSTYAYQIFCYLTYNSETQPFPFSDWPSASVLVETVVVEAKAAAAKPARKAAAPRKRAPAKPKTTTVAKKPAASKADVGTTEASDKPATSE
ncbi:MAG: hypothetical protein AUK35_11320 [Zetaproteobacteria bacterium CG2_30_46_52]|nr:MAG: hypothetical protein AUK35_11320 [Zetaproteobacteria bacterium CG2_30_46_52]